ncbi:hypothetical protein [Mycolicibacterium sediminis]|uniref:DUF5642 domain-containing protein n=1 Tax=Mycolicibacterium sediminis TaxID=1286180 RepID=A0A7I7QSL0_9MYCO|nr:hypothetical protein [Mycolicibacterium sediminis]BBY29363.1 hypothetical protein MSEDJ_34590 [Mycolicibacterium sediminis]
MGGPGIRVLALVAAVAVLAGCGTAVEGTATWPGARLDRGVLGAADFPPGVGYDVVEDAPAESDGPGGPPAMLSEPRGCANGLTEVIAASAERGPGSAVRYVVTYDGARILVTVLSWPLDLDGLAAEADRCDAFEAYFDPTSPGIPMTTTALPTPRPDALAYRQTMRLGGAESSVYFWFGNVGASAVFAVAFPTPNPTIGVKAELPQTFMDVAVTQTDRLGGA